MIARRLLVAAIAATWGVVLLTGCGSSGSSGAVSQPPQHLSAVALGQDEVSKMVLGGGDLLGFSVRSTGAETFNDQLPPRGMPRFALAKRLIRANWVASAHSDVMSADHRVQVLSDANLFKNPAAAERIWKLERIPAPKESIRTLKTPAGAPTGSRLVYIRQGGHAAFEMGWVQGRVIAIVLLFARPSDTFTRPARAETRNGGCLRTER